MGALSKFRHNLGNAFLGTLDDVRQKVVEEGWTGSTQTQAHSLDTQYSDFVAWLYGKGQSEPDTENVQNGLGGNGPTGSDSTAAWVARATEGHDAPSAGRDEPPEIGEDDGLGL